MLGSGNGRTIEIIKAYREGKADKYHQFLIEHAERFDISPKKVEDIRKPVLVRELVTQVDRAKFARDSNLSDL